MKKIAFCILAAMVVLTTSVAVSFSNTTSAAPKTHTVSTAKPVKIPYINKEVKHVTNRLLAKENIRRDPETEQVTEEPERDPDGAGAVDSEVTGTDGVFEEEGGSIQESTDDTGSNGGDYGLEYLGEWTITAYCPCEICCGEWSTGCTASGVLATSNHTIACNDLPFGTQVIIDDVIYTVEDTGWTPYGSAWIDIFFDTHEEALAYGLQTKSVYMITH